MLHQKGLKGVARVVQRLMLGLLQVWYKFQGSKSMELQMTPEHIQRAGDIPVYERLKDVPFEQIMTYYESILNVH